MTFPALAKQSVSAWIDDYATSMGAALSYYTLFSLAPLLLIVISVAGLVFNGETARHQVLATVVGVITLILIGLYLGKTGVTSGFGAAGSVVVLMVWVFYSSQIFLLGAEFTWLSARRRVAKRRQPLESNHRSPE